MHKSYLILLAALLAAVSLLAVDYLNQNEFDF
jgi:hypothetical protein